MKYQSNDRACHVTVTLPAFSFHMWRDGVYHVG